MINRKTVEQYRTHKKNQMAETVLILRRIIRRVYGERTASVIDRERERWADEQNASTAHCPTCGSPDPARHPAVQFEGEVEICADSFHQAKRASAATDAQGESRG